MVSSLFKVNEHTLIISEYEKEKFWLIISLILSYYLGVYLNLLSQLIICMNDDVLLVMMHSNEKLKKILSRNNVDDKKVSITLINDRFKHF